MSEHEEYIPICTEPNIDNERRCMKCAVKLCRIRDGTTDSNFRCHNCYWREQNTRARREKDIVQLICYRCENTFDWKNGISNYCYDCLS